MPAAQRVHAVRMDHRWHVGHGHQHSHAPVVGGPAQQAEDQVAICQAQPDGGIVDDQELRPSHERMGDRDQHPGRVGELVPQAIGAILDADFGEHPPGARASTKVGPEVFGLVRHFCATDALASSPELKPWVYCKSTMRMSPSMPFLTIAAIW